MEHYSLKNSVHPTALLEGNISMGEGNVIGPYVVMRGNITIGNGNVMDTGVTLENNVMVGDQTRFYPYAAVGALGEMGVKGDRFVEQGKVIIGNNVTIREFVCIHSPVYTLETRVDDDVYLMNKSYVAHDCLIGKGTVLSAGALLAGRCQIGIHVNIGLGVTVHQGRHIGKFSMIGMQSVIVKDILPFATVVGNPARILKFNRKGAEQIGYAENLLSEMETCFFNLSHRDLTSSNPMIQEVNQFLDQHPDALVQLKMIND